MTSFPLYLGSLKTSSQPDILGSSVLGSDEIYTKWKTFVYQQHLSTKLVQVMIRWLPWQQYSPWYMISVDIKDCFDSILSDLLIKLLKQTLTQVSDSITKSDKISCS